MILAHPFLSENIEFKDNSINTLIVENPTAFRNMISQLIDETNGYNGDFVLSEKFEPVKIEKYVEIVADIFSVNFSDRRFISKINKEALNASGSFSEMTADLIMKLNEIGDSIASVLDFEATFKQIDNLEDVIKILNFSIDIDELSLDNKIIQYVKLCNAFFGKELFVFVNIKNFFEDEELKELYKKLRYEKYNVLFIESSKREYTDEFESILTIDKDLCEI